jgi:hypothetical protein
VLLEVLLERLSGCGRCGHARHSTDSDGARLVPELVGEDGRVSTDPDDEGGGDPACWARRVCPACGRLNEAERPQRCEQCGASMAEMDDD